MSLWINSCDHLNEYDYRHDYWSSRLGVWRVASTPPCKNSVENLPYSPHGETELMMTEVNEPITFDEIVIVRVQTVNK